MTTVILNIDGRNERPQQYRRPNTRYSRQQQEVEQTVQQQPAPQQQKPEEIEDKCGWAELWGRENSLRNAKDIFFG